MFVYFIAGDALHVVVVVVVVVDDDDAAVCSILFYSILQVD